MLKDQPLVGPTTSPVVPGPAKPSLGKVFGPIGFAQALWQGSLPLKFGVILLSNDLVWWIPFAMILRGAYRERLRGRRGPAPPDRVDLP